MRGDLGGDLGGPLVDRQPDEQITPIFVALELGRWRAIVLHRTEDLGDTGRTPFREVQFLQELAEASVAAETAGLSSPIRAAAWWGPRSQRIQIQV